MRSVIILGLIATLSAVSCREIHQYHHHLTHRVNNTPALKRLKEVKNKRGVGDYPFGLPSSSIPHGGYGHALSGPSYGGYGSFGSPSPLGISPTSFSFPAPTSPTLAALGSNGLSNLGQSFQIGQSSGYNLPSSNLNLAGLLGGQLNGQATYSSPSIGLISPSHEGGSVDFGAHVASAAHNHQKYTPLYSTTLQLEPSAKPTATPITIGSAQGYSIPASALGLSPQGISLSSLSSGNGHTYNISPSSSASSGGSSSQAVSGGYVVAGSSGGHQPSSSASYNIPVSVLSASPSSSGYSLTIPSNHASIGASYQLPGAQAYTALSSGSIPNSFSKFTPASSDGSIYAGNIDNIRSYSTALKLANFASPSSHFGSQSQSHHSNSAHTSSAGSSYAPVQSYASFTAPSSSMPVTYMTLPPSFLSSSDVGPSSTKQLSHSVSSYGSPTSAHYTIPSTSYGIPSESIQTISSSNYKPQSSSHSSPSASYNLAQVSSSYSASNNAYSAPSSSSSSNSHPSSSSYKSQESSFSHQPSTISFSEPSMNYESSSGSSSSGEAESISSYKTPSTGSSATLSNSIDNYSSQGQSNSYESSPSDSGSSYSSPSTRYHRFPVNRPPPSAYIENDDSVGSGSSYDTISYSVPIGKH